MEKATLIVIQKRHNGDDVIENVLNYTLNSVFADVEEMMTNELCDYDLDKMIEQFYQVQEPYECLKSHRRLFHFLLTTRVSKNMARTLDEGAVALYDYCVQKGHQCLLVPHYGSQQNHNHYHWHAVVNVKSYMTGETLLDKYTTYQEIVNYLNQSPYVQWGWKYRKDKRFVNNGCGVILPELL